MSSNKTDELAFMTASTRTKWEHPDLESIILKGLQEPVELEPNHVIIQQDELPTAVSLIHSGIVKLHRADNTRDDQILGLRSRGWWAGSTSVLIGVSSLHEITTLTACSVSSIPAEDFRKGLEDDPGLLRYFLFLHCEELFSLQQYQLMQEDVATKRLQTIWNQAKT